MAFQHCGNVSFNPLVANIFACIGGSEWRGDSVADPAWNRDLHEIEWFSGERFHDSRMPSA